MSKTYGCNFIQAYITAFATLHRQKKDLMSCEDNII